MKTKEISLLKICICVHVWGIHLQRSAKNWSQLSSTMWVLEIKQKLFCLVI